jgi:hypothetical protein
MGHFGKLVRFVRLNMRGGSIGIEFIATYRFPDAVREKFAHAHPELDDEAHTQVFEGLKSYFAVCAVAPGAIAGMPSRIVEGAWHTFMQFTRDYAAFCECAFGRPLHAPDDAGGSDTARAALGHTWRVACAREHIDARRASRLPLLFAIDRRLKVPNGRYYALNDTDAEAARCLLGAASIVYLAAAMAGLGNDADGIFLLPHGDAAPDALGEITGGGDLGDVSGGGDFGGTA